MPGADTQHSHGVKSVRVLTVAFTLIALLGTGIIGISEAKAADSELNKLTENRTALLQQLSEPVYQCLDNTSNTVNSASVLFNSCRDWHSSVHAHYALFAYTELTGDAAGATRANKFLSAENLTRELKYMQYGLVNTIEEAYGYAWFLRLSQQRERLTGDTSLRPLAEHAVATMRRTLQADWTTVKATEHNNLSWALINFYEWAVYTGNTADQQLARTIYNNRVKTVSCDLSADTTTSATGFLSPCLMRLAAAAVIEGDSAKDYLGSQIPVNYSIAVRQGSGAQHYNGLNFSRAYALSAIAKVTRDAKLLENAAYLINWQMQSENQWMWATNYSNTHWIPQLGINAIAELTSAVAMQPLPSPSPSTVQDTPDPEPSDSLTATPSSTVTPTASSTPSATPSSTSSSTPGPTPSPTPGMTIPSIVITINTGAQPSPTMSVTPTTQPSATISEPGVEPTPTEEPIVTPSVPPVTPTIPSVSITYVPDPDPIITFSIVFLP